MAVSDFLWSARARGEFAALFDDANYSDAFKRSVADTLVRGWSNNRDKPFWAMSILVVAIARAGGGDDGLDLVWQNVNEVKERLIYLPDDDLASLDCRISEDDGTLLIHTPDGDFRLTTHRFRVLRKLAEFFLCCDDFAHAQTIMSVLSGLASSPDTTYAEIKEATRELARIGYRFRTDNFLDGHASSTFSVINSYLAKRDFILVDHTIFEFWSDEENERYKTYEATYQAFANYTAAMEEARTVHAEANAYDIHDPALAGALTDLANDDPLDHDDPSHALEPHIVPDDTGDDPDDAVDHELPTDPAILGDANLRLFGQKDVTLLSRLFEIHPFGANHGLASIRLVAFHPIQSGISNGLRTGKWKVPLAERITCREAKTYAEIVDELTGLKQQASSWLEVAFSLASDAGTEGTAADDIRQSGLAILAKSRSKSLQKDQATLRSEFLGVTPALVEARDLAERFAALFSNVIASGTEPDAVDQFATDKALFSAEFRRRYASHADDATDPPPLERHEQKGSGA